MNYTPKTVLAAGVPWPYDPTRPIPPRKGRRKGCEATNAIKVQTRGEGTDEWVDHRSITAAAAATGVSLTHAVAMLKGRRKSDRFVTVKGVFFLRYKEVQ